MPGNQEIELTETSFLISRTDLNGAITYVNEELCYFSGFERTDLIGSNHNILRHPDMPSIIFAQMWKSIKSGDKWHGYIKNKTKSGDFYWVDAEVSPHIKDGERVGYKSVRKMVPPELKILLDREYEKLRKDEDGRFNTWTVKNENYEAFDAISKELDISKNDLFVKMLALAKKMLKKR